LPRAILALRCSETLAQHESRNAHDVELDLFNFDALSQPAGDAI